jgi:two-component system invasion response regulator UvrY
LTENALFMDILIADDHSAVRHGLALLTQETLGESCIIDFAQSGNEVLERLQQKTYTILLSDLVMPDQKGMALIGQALALQPQLRIIIISVGPERDFAAQCIQSGAYAYINKGVSDLAFSKIIRSVAYESDNYLAHNRRMVIHEPAADGGELKSFKLLSQREHEIVLLLLQGQGIMEIAKALSISPSAASTLKGRAFTKLHVQSVVELNRLAYYQGLHHDGSVQS